MMFVSYTPMDVIGTEAGLSLLTKMTQSIWSGSFFGAAILGIFVFLSLAKIAMDGIIEHKYERALFEFVRLAIVVVLFTATGTATIFNMSILNFGYANQAEQNGSTVAGTIINYIFGNGNPKPTSATIQAYNVPLMAEIYAIADNLVYQITNIMLNPQKNTTIDVANMVLDPKNILYDSWLSIIKSQTNPGTMFKTFAKCYDPQDYDSLSKLGGDTLSCDDFNQQWATAAQNIVNQIQQNGNVDPTALGNMKYFVTLIQSGALQNNDSLKNAYLGQELQTMSTAAKEIQKVHESGALTNATNPANNWAESLINNLQATFGFFMGAIGLVGANIVSPKQFLESMMIMIQEYAIAIMFILLPLVVVVGLLPIFGNNYKLILKYAFSFFLIKLWIPVYWFIYVAMMDITAIMMSSAVPIHNGIHYIDNGIQYAITTFVGQSAYAQPITSQTSGIPSTSSQQVQSTINAMYVANEANRWSDFNSILLSFFAIAIPGVFGSSATYLIGKETMRAGAAALVEGLLFMQKLGGMVAGGMAKGAGLLAKGTSRLGGKGGGTGVPEVVYDARLVEEPAALPGGRGAPADRMLEKPEPVTYTGRAPRGAKQLTGSSTSWNYGEKEKEPVATGLLMFKDGTKIKTDFAGDGSILSAKMKKPGSDKPIDLTPDEFMHYAKSNHDQIEASALLNRKTGKVIEVDENNKETSYTLEGKELKETINKIDKDEW